MMKEADVKKLIREAISAEAKKEREYRSLQFDQERLREFADVGDKFTYCGIDMWVGQIGEDHGYNPSVAMMEAEYCLPSLGFWSRRFYRWDLPRLIKENNRLR